MMLHDENIDYYKSGRYLNHLKKRYRANRLFSALGFIAVAMTLLFLGFLLSSLFIKGIPAFVKTDLKITISKQEVKKALEKNDFENSLKNLVYTQLSSEIPPLKKEEFFELVSPFAFHPLQEERIKSQLTRNFSQQISLSFLASDAVDHYLKHPKESFLSQSQKQLIAKMTKKGFFQQKLNLSFLTKPDSREAEEAGIAGALSGSIMLIFLTALICVPIGIGAAIYLEEFAPKNKFIDFIEVNINNLAAVPSIVFGLLGLSVFINYLHLPRSTPLIGGIVLSLMTLPPVIMNARLAIQNVPSSIRWASLGLGASPMQVILHHILPLSLPGIMTGTIIGLARALGETAPLLMIGMVAFIADISFSPLEASTALPVQIYMWANSPEPGFIEKSSGAILILLLILLFVNLIAIKIRHKFEKEWS